MCLDCPMLNQLTWTRTKNAHVTFGCLVGFIGRTSVKQLVPEIKVSVLVCVGSHHRVPGVWINNMFC